MLEQTRNFRKTTKCIEKLSKLTGRNVILYYGKLGEVKNSVREYDLDDLKKCVHRMQRAKGLDLVLHVGGSNQEVAEKVVKFLSSEFLGEDGIPDIRVFLPDKVERAGSIIALGAKEIWMHEDAVMTGVDPGLNGCSAKTLLNIYEVTKKEFRGIDPKSIGLNQYSSGLYSRKSAGALVEADLLLSMSDDILWSVLTNAMFDGSQDADRNTVRVIVAKFNNREEFEKDPYTFHLKALQDMKIKGDDLKNAKAMSLKDGSLKEAVMNLYEAVVSESKDTGIGKVIAKQSGVMSDVGSEALSSWQDRYAMIKEIEALTNRKLLVLYYDQGKAKSQITLEDSERVGNILDKMTSKKKGIDVLLNTPGGDPYETCKIIDLLREQFNGNIRVIVPQYAMSAGTLLTCAGKEIMMGHQSNLGPMDLQHYNRIQRKNDALTDLIAEIDYALKEALKDDQDRWYWQKILSRYGVYFESMFGNGAIAYFKEKEILRYNLDELEKTFKELKEKMICMQKEMKEKEYDYLLSGMFNREDSKKVHKIVEALNNRRAVMSHGRCLNAEYCKNLGLNISMIEDQNTEFQDKILELHSCYMTLFRRSDKERIIEGADWSLTYHPDINPSKSWNKDIARRS